MGHLGRTGQRRGCEEVMEGLYVRKEREIERSGKEVTAALNHQNLVYLAAAEVIHLRRPNVTQAKKPPLPWMVQK